MSSPLDDADPWVFFADLMQAVAAADPARAAALSAGLDFPGQALAHGLMTFAGERRSELAREAAEVAAKAAAAGQQQQPGGVAALPR